MARTYLTSGNEPTILWGWDFAAAVSDSLRGRVTLHFKKNCPFKKNFNSFFFLTWGFSKKD
jgi:hypothetical protein